jgi:hypothetical protein
MIRKKLLFIPVIVLSTGIFLSCGGNNASGNETGSGSKDAKAKLFAENLCKFAKEIGLDENLKLNEEFLSKNADKIEGKFYDNSDKLISVMKEIDTHLKTLNQAQSQVFTKELLKAIIDTDCSNIFFKEIPYSQLGDVIKEIEKEVTRAKYRKDNPESEYDYGMGTENAYTEEAIPY